MDLHLKNKTALVLAASKGMGRAIATALSAEGAKVIIGSRDEAELKKTAEEISITNRKRSFCYWRRCFKRRSNR